MWKYTNVSREEFDRRKEFVAKTLTDLGCTVSDDLSFADLPDKRPMYQFGKKYYRISEIRFDSAPFIVLECGSHDEVMKNIMEDIDPFPYHIPDEEIFAELKRELGIVPYDI